MNLKYIYLIILLISVIGGGSTQQLFSKAKNEVISGKSLNENEFVRESENTSDSIIFLTPKQNSDSLKKLLLSGYRTFILRAGTVYTLSNIELPSNTTISGNGAIVIPENTNSKCFTLTNVTNIRLKDICFRGQIANAAGSSLNTSHVAVQVQRSQDVLIHGCIFKNWLGAGIVWQNFTVWFVNNR